MRYGETIARLIVNASGAMIKIVYSLFGATRKNYLLFCLVDNLIQTQQLELGGAGSMKLYSPNSDTLFRAEKFFTKEPETLRWIDSFRDGDVFWDIGANIGVYSLYTALTKKIDVVAFEPSFANYWILNNNIKLNNLSNRVTAFCLAVSDAMMIGKFNMADTDMGGACYHFGGKVDSFKYAGVIEKNVKFTQGMMGLSIDELVYRLQQPFPNHIKIDVDGIEEQILDGAAKVLSDARLQSVSVEFDERLCDVVERVIKKMEQAGLTLVRKEHSPEIEADEDSRHSYNYLFSK